MQASFPEKSSPLSVPGLLPTASNTRTVDRNAVSARSPWRQLKLPAWETTNKIRAPELGGGGGGAGSGGETPTKLSNPSVDSQTQSGVGFLRHRPNMQDTFGLWPFSTPFSGKQN